MRLGGRVAFECSSTSAYWDDASLSEFVDELGLVKVTVRGCRVGLKDSVTGRPIGKAWTVATNDPFLIRDLQSFSECKCTGAVRTHIPATG